MKERDRRVLQALRRLAEHPSTPVEERNVALNRISKIEAKYPNATTTTGTTTGRFQSEFANRSSRPRSDPRSNIRKQSQSLLKYKIAFQQGNSWDWKYCTPGVVDSTRPLVVNFTDPICTQPQYSFILGICKMFDFVPPRNYDVTFDNAVEFLNIWAGRSRDKEWHQAFRDLAEETSRQYRNYRDVQYTPKANRYAGAGMYYEANPDEEEEHNSDMGVDADFLKWFFEKGDL